MPCDMVYKAFSFVSCHLLVCMYMYVSLYKKKSINYLVGYSIVDFSKAFGLLVFLMKHYKATIYAYVLLRSIGGHLNTPTIL